MAENPLKCPRCGGPMSFMVDVTIKAPGRYYHNLSKFDLRHADVNPVGARWEGADKLCDDHTCNTVISSKEQHEKIRHLAEIGRLRKRVADLEKLVKEKSAC